MSHSTRADGDLSPSGVSAELLDARRSRAVPAGPWHALRQVHGRRVVSVAGTPPADRPEADALVTDRSGHVLAVHAGDCVPIGFVHESGAVAAAHAGWKGLLAGVVESAVHELRATAGDGEIIAAVGPHIHAASYEFGPDDLQQMVDRFGPQVRATTRAGQPALDLTAATTAALSQVDVEIAALSTDCTADCADHYWSHRARAESGRIALVAWLEPA